MAGARAKPPARRAPAPALTTLTIRRAEPRDAAALAALFADAAMLPLTTVPPHSSVAWWDKKLAEYADAGSLPLLAVVADSIAGVLLLRGFPNHVRRKHCSVIDLFAVRNALRRQGVGRRLLETAIAACDGWLQVRRIEVAISAASVPLRRYYASLGFSEEGVAAAQQMHDGRYADQVLLARINAAVLPAPVAPPLAAARRPRKTAAPKLTIRPATEDDAEAFAQVFADRSAAMGTLQHPYTSAAVWQTRLASNTSSRQIVLAAVINGRVVGNAGVHAHSDLPAHRHVCSLGIAIVAACQGQGVGRALMIACLDFADRWANYARIELTVHADNARAIQLYESLGFVTEGRHRDYSFRDGGYVDALFMARMTSDLAGTA